MQIKHYEKKFKDLMKDMSMSGILQWAKSHGVATKTLKEDFESNNNDFKKFCFMYAKSITKGTPSCTTYAAVVATIASHYGVAYKAYAGFCLCKTSPSYNAEKADEARNNHKDYANHVYIDVNGTYYEYLCGDTSNIDHIDCVEIG